MYKQDIEGSVAHATMLCEQGIISAEDMNKIVVTLKKILSEIEEGVLKSTLRPRIFTALWNLSLQSVSATRESACTRPASRNDQVALDLRMYLREVRAVQKLILRLQRGCPYGGEHTGTVMPGYTHLQRAQPVTFAHHLLAYGDAHEAITGGWTTAVCAHGRDAARLRRARNDDLSHKPRPHGAGPGLPHHNRTAWTVRGRPRFRDRACRRPVHSDDAPVPLFGGDHPLEQRRVPALRWTTPTPPARPSCRRRKIPTLPSLCAAKTGRAYGDLVCAADTSWEFPLAYNKDMQEDKQAVFDAVDTVKCAWTCSRPCLKP